MCFHSLLHSPVATDPNIVSLVQVSATTVRVEWSQPSGGASVTGYTVHYSSNNGGTNSISGLPSTSTSHEITGLTNGRTYSISVEATSEQLSGESAVNTITLCECFLSDIRYESNGRKFNRLYIVHVQIYAE